MKLMKIKGNQFSWTGNKGVAEASTLGFRAGKVPGAQIYDDATDWGFYVDGNFKMILFTLIGEYEYNWDYRSECGKFEITIFND